MKILLLRFPLREQNRFTIPWHLAFFKQILEPMGHQVVILDGQVDPMSTEQYVQYALDGEFELVGLGGIATCFGKMQKFSRLMKEARPEVTLVAGGHVTADIPFIMEKTRVDIIINGEGELVLANLVQALAEGRDWQGIKGLSYRAGGDIVRNPDERLLDMDELPDLDLSQLPLEKYDTSVPGYFLVDDEARRLEQAGYKALHFFPARGCPYRCTFCYRHIPKYRYYKREKLDRMFAYLKDNGFAFLVLSDECITANRKHFTTICELARKHGIYWLSNSRVNYITEDVLDLALSHNCVGLKYGVESFDQQMLDAMKKGTTVRQNIDALNLGYRYGLVVPLQLILGTDGENRDTILNTRRGVWSYWPTEDQANVAILNPYPGTPDYLLALEKGLIQDKEAFHLGLTNQNKAEMSVNFSLLSEAELKAWQWWLHVEQALSYRVKLRTWRLDRSFRYRLRRFAGAYLRLLKEPANFFQFNRYLLRGVDYWFDRPPVLQWREKFPGRATT
jgi:anaerobic magnesium-protoporphyrin IX monomethyl ester cyclase